MIWLPVWLTGACFCCRFGVILICFNNGCKNIEFNNPYSCELCFEKFIITNTCSRSVFTVVRSLESWTDGMVTCLVNWCLFDSRFGVILIYLNNGCKNFAFNNPYSCDLCFAKLLIITDTCSRPVVTVARSLETWMDEMVCRFSEVLKFKRFFIY